MIHVRPSLCSLFLLFASICAVASCRSHAAAVFLRIRVAEPAAPRFRITVGGFRHAGEPWYFSPVRQEAPRGQWSAWIDLSTWPWHGRLNRSGGIAEWPTVKLTVEPIGAAGKFAPDCSIDVQLSDIPADDGPAIAFTERSASRSIAFLVPTPLREHAKELETGSAMTARHQGWAKEACGGRPISLKNFDVCTSIWGHYDPALARQDLQTLRYLGFNVINAEGGARAEDLRELGFRTYRATWLYGADPREITRQWNDFARRRLGPSLASPEGRWELRDGVAHWVLADEVRCVNFKGVNAPDVNTWFREYLRAHAISDDLGRPIGQIEYPLEVLEKTARPRDADLPTRRLIYHAARFAQRWSARQLRHTSDLIRDSLPNAKTETLPTDHGFLNAWGPPCIGMSYPLLDLFEVGRQQSVDQLSCEDWLGLNHMYGPGSTWTGAQTFEYFGAILRSGIGDRPILLRGLITPSDDGFLRLKAYSLLGQGARSFFFWTFGPTYIGTENYWSDLRSMYDGIAKTTRAIEKSEDLLMQARPVRDPVAILYSVSHDIWHTDNPAAFVEKRLLWHALRHLSIQGDFLSEQDIEDGRLELYKALYITDWCITRRASAAIDAWIRSGGVVCLSAGAATRDEYYEPYTPPFAAAVYPDNAAAAFVAERHRYNERVDLTTIKPLTTASIVIDGRSFTLPVLGCRMDLRRDAGRAFGHFADHAPAAVSIAHGRGHVFAIGFCPMLAYGQLAGFKPTTLEERWPAEPRQVIRLPLRTVRLDQAVRTDHPVVEASLLSGAKGSILVLANYTYQPIASLTVDVRTVLPIRSAVSTEGSPVVVRRTPTGARLHLPLAWTDLLVLNH